MSPAATKPAPNPTPTPQAAATFTRACKCTPGAPGTVTFSYDDAVPGAVTAACSKCSTSSAALKIQSYFQP